jgi:hypothetical protein
MVISERGKLSPVRGEKCQNCSGIFSGAKK